MCIIISDKIVFPYAFGHIHAAAYYNNTLLYKKKIRMRLGNRHIKKCVVRNVVSTKKVYYKHVPILRKLL